MDNLPESPFDYCHITAMPAADNGSSGSRAPNVALLIRWINELQLPANRDFALQNLANNTDVCKDLAILLWESVGTVITLLSEVTEVYPEFSEPTLTQKTSNRVYNVLLLFKCIAGHPETQKPFLKAMLPHYLLPFLDTIYMDSPHEYLKLGSLGVIATLAKAETGDILKFLLDTEVVPSCIKCIQMGSVDSKTLATFIIMKILVTEEGLKHCCKFAERYFIIGHALRFVVDELAAAEKPSEDLFKFVITCYVRLSSKRRARNGLRLSFPSKLLDNTFIQLLRRDPVAMDYRMQLLQNIAIPNRGAF